ncbi:MAG: (deoxy)nucleoside triphosphate pyrophosphohydrolase [Firmicutes bacterium]|nr:(deoxy)nucleoside triphosphate pyrophosphohydrolase [Bacillota bacterium]
MKVVTAAIILHNDQILIAQRKRGERLASKWEFPGGKLEEGETPEECLRREINEELKINITINKYFGESIYHYHHGAIRLLAYLSDWEEGEITPTVHSQVKWVTPEELTNYDFSPADIPIVKKLCKNFTWILNDR